VRCDILFLSTLLIPLATAQSLLPAPDTSSTPAPQPSFTLQERWDHYVYRTYSWQRLALLGVDVSTDMAFSKPKHGRTAGVFADRYTGGFLRRTTRTSIEYGAGILLHEDVRRRESGRTGLAPRLKYALAHTWTAYQPDGTSRFAWSRLAGAAGGITVFEAWDNKPLRTGRLAHKVSWALASNVQDALLAEFSSDMRRFGMKMKKRLLPSSSKD
jgi:hypothetical protein